MESTEAGWARTLHSDVNAAAVTWSIISPELTPGSLVRNGGRSPYSGLISRSIRRSEMLPNSVRAMDMKSSAIASGWP